MPTDDRKIIKLGYVTQVFHDSDGYRPTDQWQEIIKGKQLVLLVDQETPDFVVLRFVRDWKNELDKKLAEK